MAEFEPITTQEAFDVAVADRLAPFADYDDLKAQNADYASRIHAFEMSELKTRIAHEVGIPFDLSQRLTGENEDAIRKDAQSSPSCSSPRPPNRPRAAPSPQAAAAAAMPCAPSPTT